MIPAVGEIVWFYRNRVSEPLAAIVAYVHRPSVMVKFGGPGAPNTAGSAEKPVGWPMVNLMVIAEDGIPFNKVGVPFFENNLAPDGGYCKPRGAHG